MLHSGKHTWLTDQHFPSSIYAHTMTSLPIRFQASIHNLPLLQLVALLHLLIELLLIDCIVFNYADGKGPSGSGMCASSALTFIVPTVNQGYKRCKDPKLPFWGFERLHKCHVSKRKVARPRHQDATDPWQRQFGLCILSLARKIREEAALD